MLLNEITEQKLDTVLALNDQGKFIFFDSLITQYYPHIEKNSQEYVNILNHYKACWAMEKIYRNNIFMKEFFTPVYTKTGLIRNIWNDLYFTDDDLIVH